MTEAFLAHLQDLFAPLGHLRVRSMFGGHGLYLDELFFALVIDEALYLKTDAQTQPRFAAAGCQAFVYAAGPRPITMSYWSVPDEAMDSPQTMQPWAADALAAARRRPPASRRRRRRAAP